jgi:hypothetical protein
LPDVSPLSRKLEHSLFTEGYEKIRPQPRRAASCPVTVVLRAPWARVSRLVFLSSRTR